MKATEKLKTRLRASWRELLISLLQVTYRVQDGLTARINRLPAR